MKHKKSIPRDLAILFCLHLLFYSCNDEYNGKNYYYNLSEPCKEYFNTYKIGNWWVFENGLKTKRDSIFVTTYVETYKELESGNYQSFYSGLKSSLYNKSYLEVELENKDKHYSDCYFNYVLSPLIRFDSDSNAFYFGSGYSTKGIYVDTTINGFLYQSLLTGGNNVMGFSKHIGLTYYIYNQDTFNLIKYHIQ